MVVSRSLLAALALARLLPAEECLPLAPCYTSAEVVNSASGQTNVLAPYTFATIYRHGTDPGTELSYRTAGRRIGDYSPSLGGVSVLLDSFPAMVFYASPNQVNFLTPARAGIGTATLQLGRDGVYGPKVTVPFFQFAPALFQLDIFNAVAQRFPSYQVATPEAPAHPGEYVILYATGLGDYFPPADDYLPPPGVYPMASRQSLQILLDGVPVDDRLIEYAGSVANYWGLFQINLKLPGHMPDNPEIRLVMAGSSWSPPGLRLPMRAE